MTSITRFALSHRRLVALAWIALTIAGGLTASSTTGRLTHSFATPGNPGYDTNLRIMKTFGVDGNEQPTIAVLQLPAGRTMQTAAGRAAAARTFAAAHNAGHLAVADYANTHNPVLVSADGRTTWALIDMPNPALPLGSGVMGRIPPALKAAAPTGATVAVTGFEQLQTGGGGSGPSTLVETIIGMVGGLAILAFVFGSAIAIVPLLMAVPAILTSMLLVGGVTHLTDISFIVEYLVALIGLGVAIDYSLLIVTRWREERERGLSNEDAVVAAGATAGRAVVLSGLTVTVGLLSLVVLPVPFLRSIGYGGMLIPLGAIAAAVTLLAAQIAAPTLGVYSLLPPNTASFRHGEDALISVIPRAEGNTASGRATVDRLRARLAALPAVEVGGNTAQNKDFVHAVYGNFPLMLGLIALITFLLLARAFRSVVLALKAVVLNVISLGAAYGFLVLFWQQGHGSHLIYGVPATGSIRDFIPIIVFAFLFGLSMDYEVFVLARMREEYDKTGSTPKAIVNALSHTGRLVTCAALILAVSFISLSTNPDLPVRTIATGLSFGILLDAIVIRTLLVPALVALLGRWNWWMPERLGQLLRIRPTPVPTA